MSKYNQFAGRTVAAWAKRCDAKRARAQALAGNLGGVVIGLKIGGPGVPGGLENRFDIAMPTGKRLTMRQARAAIAKAELDAMRRRENDLLPTPVSATTSETV